MSDRESSGTAFALTPVAIIQSPYKEKFAIPRQPGLNNEAIQTIELLPPFNKPESVRGLESVSHIWVEFIFHKAIKEQPKLTVRPPRLGGNERLGVFATRATHRPNSVGLSVVELLSINTEQGVQLVIKGGDFLDQTPVIDIKPYLPYVDSVPTAYNQIAEYAPTPISVTIATSLISQWNLIEKNTQKFIVEALAYDPKPSYIKVDSERTYGVKLDNYDIGFHYLNDEQIEIISCQTF